MKRKAGERGEEKQTPLHQTNDQRPAKSLRLSSAGSEEGYLFDDPFLPPETCELIFSYVDVDALPVCKFVCRAWRSVIPHLSSVKRLGSPSPPTIWIAKIAKNGNASLLKWAREQGCPWNCLTSLNATKGGHFELLQYLVEQKCPVDERITFAAAQKGRLDILMWAHEKKLPMGDITAGAVSAGCKDILEWAQKERLLTGSSLMWDTATQRGDIQLMEWLKRSIEGDITHENNYKACAIAAGAGRLDVLQWLQRNGFTWGSTTEAAAREGHLEILKWAVANGCSVGYSSASLAARGGHMDVLEWLSEGQRFSYWGDHTCVDAASGGHLKVLKWLIETKHIQCSAAVTAAAASKGHRDVFLWAKQNGCPVDAQVCTDAIKAGDLERLKWARENGCPWDSWAGYYAIRGQNQEIIEWLKANGYRFA